MIQFNVFIPQIVKDNLPYKNFEQISYDINLSVKIAGQFFMNVSDFPVYDFVSKAMWWIDHSKETFEYQREGMDDKPWISFHTTSNGQIEISSPYQKFKVNELVSRGTLKAALTKLENDVRPSDEWYAKLSSLS